MDPQILCENKINTKICIHTHAHPLEFMHGRRCDFKQWGNLMLITPLFVLLFLYHMQEQLRNDVDDGGGGDDGDDACLLLG